MELGALIFILHISAHSERERDDFFPRLLLSSGGGKTIEIDGSKQQGACCKEIPAQRRGLTDSARLFPRSQSTLMLNMQRVVKAPRKAEITLVLGPPTPSLFSPTADRCIHIELRALLERVPLSLIHISVTQIPIRVSLVHAEMMEC